MSFYGRNVPRESGDEPAYLWFVNVFPAQAGMMQAPEKGAPNCFGAPFLYAPQLVCLVQQL